MLQKLHLIMGTKQLNEVDDGGNGIACNVRMWWAEIAGENSFSLWSL